LVLNTLTGTSTTLVTLPPGALTMLTEPETEASMSSPSALLSRSMSDQRRAGDRHARAGRPRGRGDSRGA
jgi:hypothetical protein